MDKAMVFSLGKRITWEVRYPTSQFPRWYFIGHDGQNLAPCFPACCSMVTFSKRPHSGFVHGVFITLVITRQNVLDGFWGTQCLKGGIVEQDFWVRYPPWGRLHFERLSVRNSVGSSHSRYPEERLERIGLASRDCKYAFRASPGLPWAHCALPWSSKLIFIELSVSSPWGM